MKINYGNVTKPFYNAIESLGAFITRLIKFIKMRSRLLAAYLLALLIILTILGLAIRSDFESKESQEFSGSLPSGRLGYVLTFTSIDEKIQTVKGTLSLEAGLLDMGDFMKGVKVKYGELLYADIANFYLFLCRDNKDLMALANMQILSMRINQESSTIYTESMPKSKDVSFTMIGDPDRYPFDKYLIMGMVSCYAYLDSPPKKIDIFKNELKTEESLLIKSFINRQFIMIPTQKELQNFKKSIPFSFGNRNKIITKDEVESLNNNKNCFVLIIKRPILLQLLTIILGIIAALSAIYIGCFANLDDILFKIVGYVIALWTIRNIILGNTGSAPLLIDYAILTMYLIVFVGIICRKIVIKKTREIKCSERS